MGWTLALGLTATLLAPPPCRYEPPVPEAEERYAYAIEMRKGYGMRSSRAYVERLDRDPAARRRGRFEGGFPVTRRERAYLEERDRVADDADRVSRRLRRHRAISAGIAIADDYPHGAYIEVRVTRRLTRAERARLGRGVVRLRVKRVPLSLRALLRQQDAIDFEAAERAGIRLWLTAPDGTRGTIDITYSSDRPDAEQVLRRMFGENLDLKRVPASHESCASPESYELAPDGVTLTLHYLGGSDWRNLRVELVEQADRVSVALAVTESYFSIGSGQQGTVTATLAAPLGPRPVIDTLTGKPLPVRAPPPQPPRTPPR